MLETIGDLLEFNSHFQYWDNRLSVASDIMASIPKQDEHEPVFKKTMIVFCRLQDSEFSA